MIYQVFVCGVSSKSEQSPLGRATSVWYAGLQNRITHDESNSWIRLTHSALSYGDVFHLAIVVQSDH